MISHCANPECGAPFHYLRGGRLYRFETPAEAHSREAIPNAIYTMRPPRMSVYFWLCDKCSRRLSLRFQPGRGLELCPRPAVNKRGRNRPVVVESDDTASHIADSSSVDRTNTCPLCRPGTASER